MHPMQPTVTYSPPAPFPSSQGAPKPDLSTQPGASRRATLRAVYGAAVASDLLDLNTECGEWGEGEEGLPSELCVRAEGLVSGEGWGGGVGVDVGWGRRVRGDVEKGCQ